MQQSCNNCKKEKTSNSPRGSRESGVWSKIKNHAYERGIEVSIEAKDILEVYDKQNGRCALSGVEITFPKVINRLRKGTGSLDRIDNKKSYEKDNIQWVHKDVNQMKNKHTDEYFIDFCNKITDYQRDKANDRESDYQLFLKLKEKWKFE